MVSQKIKIKNPTGLHLRPAGILCTEAMKFRSTVKFQFKNTYCKCEECSKRAGSLHQMRR